MGKTRLDLQRLLESLLGSRNVYYQPPASVKMEYPAIVYFRRNIDKIGADDSTYLRNNSYLVTLIGKTPDNELIDKLLALPFCRYDRHYTADNLHHDNFILYF